MHAEPNRGNCNSHTWQGPILLKKTAKNSAEWASRHVKRTSAGTVAVRYLDPISRLAQTLANIFGDHDRAVLAAGAADGDGQVALAFVDVVRQQIYQQVGDALQKFRGLRKRPNIACHPGMTTSQRAKFRHEVRIGQEP